MVTALVSELGKVRPTCFARTMLFQAADSLEAGNVIKAGCQLREAVSRYVTALCEYYGCTPKKKHLRTPSQMNRALLKAGGIDRTIYNWLREMIDYGNRCAHCRPVRPGLIEASLATLVFTLDHTWELDFPKRGAV